LIFSRKFARTVSKKAKKISYMLTLDDTTAYELQRKFQFSELDLPTFLTDVVRTGLAKTDYVLHYIGKQEHDWEVEDQFALEWIIEEEEKKRRREQRA